MEYLRIKFMIIILTTRFFSAENFVYEVKSLFAQPDYRSVTLTFEVEKKNITTASKNDDDDEEAKERKFNINFCELQSWDEMHRCRSIVLKDSKPRPRGEKSITYKTVINKLRMSTKYSFNVKMFGEDEKSARSDDFTKNRNKVGQSIIVPTKGFSASASKCLPNESEIVVETGPNFSGRISSENGKCFVDGNAADDSTSSYTLHIDHDECGSKISNDDLTVETFITVQENSGILTHSSRKFMVVCTFQPDTLTVRARLALPKKGEANVIEDDDFWIDRGRSARHQKWQMVDKSALILKESNGIESSEAAIPAVHHQNEFHQQQQQQQNSQSSSMNDLPGNNAVKKMKTDSNRNEKKTRFQKFTATERTYASTFSLIEIFVGILIVMTIIVAVIFLLKFFTFNNNKY